MSEPQTFWEHLDELRGSIIRMIIAMVCCAVVAFCFKDTLFDVILAPQGDGFITYRVLERLGGMFSAPDGDDILSPMAVRLINTGLAQQFMIHVKTSMGIGFMMASPYILYLLFRFVSPALYAGERRYVRSLVSGGYMMFMAGVLLGYFLIFPLTFRFLGTYQVSTIVENTVTLESYIDTMIMICLSMGVVFEIPVLCWIMGRMGIIDAAMMRHYRRHVIVLLLVVAAIITPTSDVFTLLLVSLPMWLLYELSIHIVGLHRDRGCS
ncbi:MAG: twin-arginine translocase subunit TatC [Bacteroidaceae bacterium]|nr:twin-arginine translocase subunit TatC [Bacteroidaceae bacterium]